MGEPLISIITTLYNYADYLPELAESVFKQTYSNWEWIVVDDASTDDPQASLNGQLTDPRMHWLQHDTNHGYAVAKNTGIRAASGDYFVMIDADDVLLPESLQCRFETLNMLPHKLWVHADALNYSENGEIERRYIKWIQSKRRQLIAQGLDLNTTYHHRLIHAQTVMVRREFHERLGLYDETLRFSADNEMWRRAIRFGVIPVYLAEPVAIYRAHDRRMSRSQYKRQRLAETKQYIKAVVERRFSEGLEATGTPLL